MEQQYEQELSKIKGKGLKTTKNKSSLKDTSKPYLAERLQNENVSLSNDFKEHIVYIKQILKQENADM